MIGMVFDSRTRYYLVQRYRLLVNAYVAIILAAISSLILVLWLILFLFQAPVILLGLAFLLTGLTSALWLVFTFGITYYPYVEPPLTVGLIKGGSAPESPNLAEAASFALLQALGPSSARPTAANFPQAARHLFISPFLQQFWRRLQIEPAQLYEIFQQHLLPAFSWSQFCEGLLKQSSATGYFEPEDAIAAILLHPSLHSSLNRFGLTVADIQFTLWWNLATRRAGQTRRAWWRPERLRAITSHGQSWAASFTPLLDRLHHPPRGQSWEYLFFGHEHKVREIMTILARPGQGNVVIVSHPGAGRLGVVHEILHRIHVNQALPGVNGRRAVYLHLGQIIAAGSSSAGQRSILERVLNEINRAGNLIVFFDGLDHVLQSSRSSSEDLSDIIQLFAASTAAKIVIVASPETYHGHLQNNTELMNFFSVVMLGSLSSQATLQRLALAAPLFESTQGIFIPYLALRAIMDDTDSILPQIPYPERAFDFLSEALVLAREEHANTLTPDHIHHLVSRKIGLNLGSFRAAEKHRLLHLTDAMHKRVVNQSAALSALSRALLRARAEIRDPNRPICTFLFLGPTGVGKTETAKALAACYFGSADYFIRLDMSEFSRPDAVALLLGGLNLPAGRLTSQVADHPFGILLLDEFEKSHPLVQQLFLQVFSEGRLADFAGTPYSFRHLVIIATSNAGAEFIRHHLRQGDMQPGFAASLKDHILRQGIFRPELLNRFDDVITFTPLTQSHVRQIAVLLLNDLNDRLDVKHGLKLKVTEPLLDYLVKIGYEPAFGARPMRRAIQTTIESYLSEKIIRGDFTPGETIIINPALL